MRINWGVKIIIVYSSFVVFMLTLVFMCTRHHSDLVAEDYYAQELKYQDVIDGSNNARKLTEPVRISQTASTISIQLPASQKQIENGKIFFYRPSDASKDITVPFSSNYFQLDKGRLVPGLYKVKITWTESGKNYFEEQSLPI